MIIPSFISSHSEALYSSLRNSVNTFVIWKNRTVAQIFTKPPLGDVSILKVASVVAAVYLVGLIAIKAICLFRKPPEPPKKQDPSSPQPEQRLAIRDPQPDLPQKPPCPLSTGSIALKWNRPSYFNISEFLKFNNSTLITNDSFRVGTSAVVKKVIAKKENVQFCFAYRTVSVTEKNREELKKAFEILEKCKQSPYIAGFYFYTSIPPILHSIHPFFTESLENTVKDKTIQVNQTLKDRWSFQLLSAVSFLYKNHIVHRDIKPQNILKENDNIALCDFDLACDLSDNTSLLLKNSGSPAYMSPELYRSTHISGNNRYTRLNLYANDMWATAITLLEIAYKALPKTTPLLTFSDDESVTTHFKRSLKEHSLSSKQAKVAFAILKMDPDARLNAIDSLALFSDNS